MKSKTQLLILCLTAIPLSLSLSASAAQKGKKLLVYVLAGQSNMQGHAEVSTLAYLPKPAYIPTPDEWASLTSWLDRDIRLKLEPGLKETLLKDPANARLPRNEFANLLAAALKAETDRARAQRYEAFKKRQTDPARTARDKELAAVFTPNLTDEKVLEALAAAKTQKFAPDIANTWVEKTGIPVAKHTYIAAYGGVNRASEPGEASGPLTSGYGARPTAFGPEYAFGIMMEKQLDQPVLIIKTAWGGKSLHYDFRPPSAGPYQPTSNEKQQLERWKANKAAWDLYLAGGGSAAAMAKVEKDWKALESEKRALQLAITKLTKDEQAAAQQKLAEMNQKSKELQKSLIRNPGEMPNTDAAGFYWQQMTEFIRKVLTDPKSYHPEYDPSAGYEVAGGLWFQGFNDQFDPEYYGNYATNMAHYIRDLRRELKQPDMPFVIGVLGTPAFPEEAMSNQVANAQREAATQPGLSHVTAIESWNLTTPEVALWRMKRDATDRSNTGAYTKAEQEWILHGSNLGYHYDGSGRFFIRLGDEFASAMLRLKR